MNILFLCVGNSARSQIAEGLAKSMIGPEHNIQSAGSSPAGFIHDAAILTMKDIGVDISSQSSKAIDDIDDQFIDNLDYIITLCAEEVCPSMQNNAKKIHWPTLDPAVENISTHHQRILFTNTRQNIFKMLKKFFTSEI